jgi:L-ribulokinase
MSAPPRYVIGVDFGTLSGRAVVVRVEDGEELATGVHHYRHGVMERSLDAGSTDVALPPDWALQAPADYIEVLRFAVPAAVADSGIDPGAVVGIGTDFTACTVLPVAADGTPLCELADLVDRPHAYAKLWKHHSAQPHADRVNALAAERGEPWLVRYGGRISSEWELAKGLQLLEEDPEIYHRMAHWIEAADWIVWQLTGVYVRNACTAGYKANRQDGAYPSAEYLAGLNPELAGFFAAKIERPIAQLGDRAGSLRPLAARWTGLPEGIAVCAGNVDAHVTAPAAQAIGPGQMVAIMGTSTCHVMSSGTLREVPGMCGVVDGGIVAGLWGYEAGQSGVGDIVAWYTSNHVPGSYSQAAAAAGRSLHDHLAALVEGRPVGAHGLVALDWHSGNRSVLVDHELSGLVVGLTLATAPEEIYLALMEATAFGTRTIIDSFDQAGVAVEELVVAGGLLQNRFLMQLYADVLGRPIGVIVSEQGPALGSAIHAAVAAGAYPDVRTAAKAMGKVERAAYRPDEQRTAGYDRLYAEYVALHDHFGRGASDVMHRLRAIRRDALR